MNWNDEIIDEVWQHGRVLPDVDAALWRQDACGAWMRRDEYGHASSEFGWKMERVTAGTGDAPQSLRPYHWHNRFDISQHLAHGRVKADRSGVPASEQAWPPKNRQL